MYWENTMKVTFKNKKAAVAALEVMKARLVKGFDCDKSYRRIPSMETHDALRLAGKTITLPEEFSNYLPEDAEKVIPELMKDLAEHLNNESFTFDTCNSSDYDEGWVDGSYANGELKVRTTYLPSGFGEFFCEECGEVVATMEDDAKGNIHIEYEEDGCPECGAEIDLSEWLPVITTKTIQITR